MQSYGMQKNKVMNAKKGLKVKRRRKKEQINTLEIERDNKTINYAVNLTRNHYTK